MTLAWGQGSGPETICMCTCMDELRINDIAGFKLQFDYDCDTMVTYD